MNKQELHILIEKYFQADTSLEQERQLKKELCNTTFSSALIDEARAVLGYSMIQPHTNKLTVRRFKVSIHHIAVAASIAFVATIGFIGLADNNDTSPSYAIVDGETITDDKIIFEMVKQSLDLIAEANENAQNRTDLDMKEILGNLQQ